MGLRTISDVDEVPSPTEGRALLIRAHGEPPHGYDRVGAKGFELLDCTCPVVLKLQKAIREAHARLAAKGGRLVLFGKIGHPEVLGLVGQVGGDVSVVQSLPQLQELIDSGELRTDRDIELFSQTTMSPVQYEQVRDHLLSKMVGAELTAHNTICSQVAGRHRELVEFARSHDVVVFVSGKESSNGKVLYDLCKSVNLRSYHIQTIDQINPQWFTEGDSVGICGATSTPKWQLEGVAKALAEL